MSNTSYKIIHAYKRIQAFQHKMYTKDSPVFLLSGNLLADKISGKILMFAKFGNAGEKTINFLTINIKCLDEQGNVIGVLEDFRYSGINVSPADSFGGKSPAELVYENIDSAEIILKTVQFDDGSVWVNNLQSPLEALPKQKKLKGVLKHDLYYQFIREYKNKYTLAAEYGLAEYFPVSTEDYWLCTCGQFNLFSNAVCCSCDCSKDFTFFYTNPTELERLYAQFKNEMKEQKTEKEERKQNRKEKIVKYAKIVSLFCIALIILLIINAKVIQPPVKYESGKKAYDTGEYKKAVSFLEQIPSYKDSNVLLVKASLKFISSAKAGDTVHFGRYEQDNKKINGKEAIAWRVLAVKNGKALLISVNNLDCLPFDIQPLYFAVSSVTWERCSLRKWLNNDFLKEAFTEKEQTVIAKTMLVSGGCGEDSDKKIPDKVFLLSTEEAEKYFESDEARISINTKYAQAKWEKTNENADLSGSWWLRTPGSSAGSALYVEDFGSLYENNFGYSPEETVQIYASMFVTDTSNGIRPALWIDFQQ
ncbi:MAG: DUF6273 domain-containing protein [Eubacteriales bacterium]